MRDHRETSSRSPTRHTELNNRPGDNLNKRSIYKMFLTLGGSVERTTKIFKLFLLNKNKGGGST